MNQKTLVGAIIALVLALGVMIGLYVSKVNTPQPQQISQPAVEQSPIAEPAKTSEPDSSKTPAVPTVTTESNPMTYLNNDYGFQLTFPAGWENFKVDIDDKQVVKTGIAYVHFLIPTTDKSYPTATLSTGEKLSGYADVITVSVWKKSQWEKQINSAQCKNDPTPDCPFEGSKLGVNSKYVFDISHGNGLFPDDVMGKISSLFEKIAGKTSGESVGEKLDFKILPESDLVL
jgi:hypothetical protein